MKDVSQSGPLVTVIVPSYNQGKFIRETIDSILNQDYRPIEILVLDGASTDETVRVLESYGKLPELIWVSERDKGVVDAVNKGLQRARGEIIAIQSSDDLYLPGALSAAVDAFARNRDAALVYGDVEYIDEHSQLLGQEIQSSFDLKSFLGRFLYIPQPAAFFRAEAVRETGEWRQEVSYVADADFWIRIAFQHHVYKIDRILARYRYHSDQRDTQREKIARDWERMMNDYLASHTLDSTLRRYIRMSIHLAHYIYTPESQWLERTVQLYRAAFDNPAGFLSPDFPKREMIPGYVPIRKVLSRCKRLLGFAPRGTEIPTYPMRQQLGAILYEGPNFLWGMRLSFIGSPAPWVSIRNRNERLIGMSDQSGIRCDWRWTSDLHIAKVFPSAGWYLMKRALRDWPIHLSRDEPAQTGAPQVSFVIGHRGLSRLKTLLAVIATIATQTKVEIECIVVEQSKCPEIEDALPRWVRYIHTPPPDNSMLYSRSWALNVGAREAKGDVLVLHDGDILVPQEYAAQSFYLFQDGFDVINLKRFLFYLSRSHSALIHHSYKALLEERPELVTQNTLGGASIAVSRKAYFEIGGFDEAFIGWGGEDNEFWERALTRKVWQFAYLPLLHLWHPPQSEKAGRLGAQGLYQQRSLIPAETRIQELRARDFGSVGGTPEKRN